jgi:hypothetical protein
MPTVAHAALDVPVPISEAWPFLANLENAAAWHPFVVGSATHVRAPARALSCVLLRARLRKPLRCAAKGVFALASLRARRRATWRDGCLTRRRGWAALTECCSAGHLPM